MKKLLYYLPIILPLFLFCGLFPTGASRDLIPTIFFSGATIGHVIPEIYSIKTDGSDFTQLTIRDIYAERQPSLSPDGKKILYRRDFDIHTMNIDGSNKKQLTFDIEARTPTWSPDGTKIAFQNMTDLNIGRIFIMDSDGSNQIQLTDTPEFTGKPRWLPDGSKMYYKSRSGLFIMDTNGSNHTQITDFDLRSESLLYSSEDRSFYFLNRVGHPYDLYKIDIDGTGVTFVRSFSDGKFGMSISPDLQYIAYRKDDVSDNGIYIMNIDGSGDKLLTRADYFPWIIFWSTDSQYIIYREIDDTPVSIFDKRDILNMIRPDGTDKAVITDQFHRLYTNEVGISWLF